MASVVLVGVAALTLTGCIAFKGEIKGKQVSGNEVRIDFKVCSYASDNCPNDESSTPRRRGPEIRALIAFRVPKGSKGPDSFTPVGESIQFFENKSYSKDLRNDAPTDGGEKWLGYVSEAIDETTPADGKFKVLLKLPNDAGEVFKYRPVVGYVEGENVDCGSDPFTPKGGGNAVCIDDPSRAETRKSLKIELD